MATVEDGQVVFLCPLDLVLKHFDLLLLVGVVPIEIEAYFANSNDGVG